jgi:hypothetical protein
MFRWKIMVPVVALLFAAPLALFAQAHPHYLQALRELQFARAVLAPGDRGWGPVAADQRRATAEIDRAIEELRHAAEMDGRNPNDVPPVDMHWEPRDRMRRASEALGRARDTIGQEEMNPAARMVRDRAFRHIDEAQHALRHAMDSWR